MKIRYSSVLLSLLCLPLTSAFAQTTIGGGSCTSSTLHGTYEFLLNGRQVVAATGSTTSLVQAVGTATFDGLSKVTWTLAANTAGSSQSFGTPLMYSGSYSLQSNCVGSLNITSGDSGTFTLEAYASGNSFALIGSDATYAYNGSGNIQPAACPTTLSGVHEFSGSGNMFSGSTFGAGINVAGVLQFDGQGNVTANWTQVANLTTSTVTATGTYSVTPCQVSATLTDTLNNKYSFSFVIYSTAPDFALTVTSAQLLFDGSGSQAYGAATCTSSTLNGAYELVLSGRLSPSGTPIRILSADGTATFDGQSKVAFALTANVVNGSQSFGTPLTYSGTYSLQPNCQGSITITSGDTATFSIVAYSINAANQQARALVLVGTDASYAYNGGGNVQPTACAVATLSGSWPFNATGNAISGSTSTGVVDIAGAIQFDGIGNATANWTQASNTGTVNVSATGTYSVTAACVGTVTLTDASNNKYVGQISIYGAAAPSFELVSSNPQLLFTGGGRGAFGNPAQAVVNAASFLAGETPAGSVFSIFGTNLATGVGEPTSVPLPTTVRTTTVTVNGEPAPLFYVDPNQINAQMPEDIKAGIATVVVKNGSSTSNTVGVVIPATGTPGIVVYGNNRAVVVNQNGTVNSPSAPAKAGDTLVAYFTGGGPVNAAGSLVTGSPAPAGLSPLSESNGVKVGGVDATVNYIGLTPGSIGLYQANFVVPKVAAGDRSLLITISGQNSNSPLITVSN